MVQNQTLSALWKGSPVLKPDNKILERYKMTDN